MTGDFQVGQCKSFTQPLANIMMIMMALIECSVQWDEIRLDVVMHAKHNGECTS